MSDSSIAFGGFVFDADRGLLLKDRVPVPLSHRGVTLLAALLAAEGRVVGKAELMDAAWPGQEVEESNLSVQIAALRKALGVRPDGEEWIATVPRVGYQFMRLAPASDAKEPDQQGTGDLRPSIAVLPFANLSANRDHAFFADGMTDDIIAALAGVGELLVASRGSSVAIKDKSLTAKDAARELGVRYLLEGSVRAADRQVRVTVQLTDSQTGKAVWGERYEGCFDDIFAFQDDLTRNIVQALQVTLNRGEAARLWEGQTRNLRAWEKAVQALKIFHRFTPADNAIARRLFEEAVAIDPTYTGALAWLAVTHHWDGRYSLGVDRQGAIERADRCIAAIETLNPDLPKLFTLKSYSSFLRGDHDEALRWGGEAVRRAPGDSRAHGFLGIFQVYAGKMEDALASLTEAVRQSPYPEDYQHYFLAMVHSWLGHLDKALEHGLEAERREPGEPYCAAMVAVVRSLRGEDRLAEEAVRRLREATPAFSLRNIRHSEMYRDPAHLDRFCDLLRKAGLPD